MNEVIQITKQTITIHASELKEIVEKYGRGNCNYHDAFTDIEPGNFDNLKDGYGESEYFGTPGMYIPSPEYLMYVKELNKDLISHCFHQPPYLTFHREYPRMIYPQNCTSLRLTV